MEKMPHRGSPEQGSPHSGTHWHRFGLQDQRRATQKTNCRKSTRWATARLWSSITGGCNGCARREHASLRCRTSNLNRGSFILNRFTPKSSLLGFPRRGLRRQIVGIETAQI
eukprot:s75_g15.t1